MVRYHTAGALLPTMERRQRKYGQNTDVHSHNRHRQDNKEQPIIISTVGEVLEKEITPTRGGVIIVTIHQGTLYFGLAVDSATHDLTDFGGQIYYDKDENCVTGALREFQEEILNIFEPLEIEQIKPYPALYNDNNIVIFIHLLVEPNAVSQAFLQAHSTTIQQVGSKPEVCGVTWLTMEELTKAIAAPNVIYKRVQRLLQQVTVDQWREIL
jgi:hypothetical protein